MSNNFKVYDLYANTLNVSGRPLVNGTGVALISEINQISGVVYETGDQIISGSKNFKDLLILENTGNQLSFTTGSGGNSIFIHAPIINTNRTYTIPDVGSSAAFVLTDGPQTINGAKTFSIRPTVSGTGVVLTSDDILYTTGTQTISGAKTFATNLIVQSPSNQITLKTGNAGNSVFITAPTINANRTYTLPDVGASSAAFVLNQGPQTIGGLKNFTTRPTVSGTGVLLSGEALNTLSVSISGSIRIDDSSQIYTTATAGTGSALPALPSGYLRINLNGTNIKIPYYRD
jgi:hypothetical protein